MLRPPHTPQTERMFNEQIFRSMKRGSYFIALSRGKLYDDMALVSVLKDGHLAECREVVDARVRARVRRKDDAFVEQYADAIGHGPDSTRSDPSDTHCRFSHVTRPHCR